MSLTLSLGAAQNTQVDEAADLLVILKAGPRGMGARGQGLDDQTGGAISRATAAPRLKGVSGEYTDILAPAGLTARRVIVLELGEPKEITTLSATKAGGELARLLEYEKESSATLLFDAPEGAAIPAGDILARLVLGLRLHNYRFHMMARDATAPNLDVTVIADALDEAALAHSEALADGVEFARDLVNTPASHLNPDSFPDYLAALQDNGVSVDVLEQNDLERLGMGAVLAVGNGSARPPKVIVLSYKGASGKPLALVGKGICFDAGGLCVKTGPQMFSMKGDMAGAAAVAGTMLALARQKANVHVVGVIGIAENMLSGTAYKSGDVVTTMSGRTVEVFDTDCEGRMVLADILHYAASRLDPCAIVDLATLTYSVMQGLGHVFAGLFATHTEMAEGLLEAGEKVGERFWRLPLDFAYDEGLRSPIADLRQHASDLENGDAPFAAAFLRNFTEGVPWVHLDIAGKEQAEQDRVLARSGGLGFGVQILEEWIRSNGDAMQTLK